jgi:radical SAM superfamily enzyme YgiQ (UPF0313 family)
MRVLLIVPTHLYKHRYPAFLSVTDFPVGFAYLASALRNAGHEVFGLNPNNDPGYSSAHEMLREKILRELKGHQPQIIGLGGLCTDFKFIKDAIEIIRAQAPDVPIVCGGGIINNDAEFIFDTLHPDFCIIGEGEEVLVQLTNMLESGIQDYEKIPNLGYWNQGVSKFTERDFNYIDINKRCFPDYESFGVRQMLDDFSLASRFLYRYTRADPRPMTIVTARGCPFNCTFCVHQKGPKYRSRSIENIIQEIKFLYEQYNFNILIILDELFAVNKSRLKEFCSVLIDARNNLGWDFDWMFQAHASASFDRETLEIARDAGCRFFSYGLESASPRVLASMNKKTKPPQIIEAIELANTVKMGFGGNLIFGDIAETAETIFQSLIFFYQYCMDMHVYLGFVRPYPGSDLFDNCVARGIIHNKLEYYEHMDEGHINMTSMPDELCERWADRVSYLAQSFSWVKSGDALSCAKELESVNNPMVLHSEKFIWRVEAKCPHCNKEARYRELLGFPKVKQIDSPRPGLKKHILRIARVYRREKTVGRFFKLLFKKLFWYFVTLRHPLFKLLKPLELKGGQSPVSFVTGCPHCNKRFRVNIPVANF